MNINDLKVGDRLKYKSRMGGVVKEGVIIGTYYKGYYVGRITKPEDIEEQCDFKQIISKLEPIRAEMIVPGLYKEIPIEKEKPELYDVWLCHKCNRVTFIKESKFDKYEFCNYICNECRENPKPTNESKGSYIPPDNNLPPPPYPGKKSAPKSYKSNIRLSKIKSHYMNGKGWFSNAPLNDIEGHGECNALEVTLKNIGIDSSMFDINKQYTIEIKEKE